MAKDDPIRLATALTRTDLDDDTRQLAEMLLIRLKLPMSKVLERVPGESIAEKARQISIARQTYYAWLKGETRPLMPQAQRLAELTHLDPHQIAGVPG